MKKYQKPEVVTEILLGILNLMSASETGDTDLGDITDKPSGGIPSGGGTSFNAPVRPF